MSKKWTDQQKVLHEIKLIGGATAAKPLINFATKWGLDRACTLFNAVNKHEMGIDNAINILRMACKLGPKVTKKLLMKELENKYHKNNNVIPLRRRA